MDHVVQIIRNFKGFTTNRTATQYWFPATQECKHKLENLWLKNGNTPKIRLKRKKQRKTTQRITS